MPPPRKIFCLAMMHFGAFWALNCFNVSIRRVESKSSFVCQLPIGQLSHMADVSWKITVNNWSIQKKQRERRSRCIKKERERRSRPTRTLSLILTSAKLCTLATNTKRIIQYKTILTVAYWK